LPVRGSWPPARCSPFPLAVDGRTVGTLYTPEGSDPSITVQHRFLPALAALLAVAVDHTKLEREALEAEALRRSDLVKTALLGADPNFGRVLQAAGQAMAGRAPFVVDLEIEGRPVVSGGVALDLSEAELRELAGAVAVPEVDFELTLPGEGGETEVFFSDLSHEYVSINSEYTS